MFSRILTLAALAIALPTSALAQTTPTAEPTPVPTTAPSAVAQHDHDRDALYGKNHAPGCDNISNLTARGTITYPSCVVPSNHTLLQAGYSNQSISGVGHNASYPNALIRVGTSVHNLELDFSPPTEVRSVTAAGRSNGITDVGAGLTYQLPTLGPVRATVNALVFAPTATPGFGAQRGSNYQYGLNLGSSIAGFGVGATVGFQSTIDPVTNRRYDAFVPSLAIGHQLGFGSRPGTVFVEAARFSRVASTGRAEMLYTGGYKQPLSDRVQLDVEYSTTPNLLGHRAHSIGAGVGILF